MSSTIAPFDSLEIYQSNMPLLSDDSESEYSASELSQDQIHDSLLQYTSSPSPQMNSCIICKLSCQKSEKIYCTIQGCKMRAHVCCLALKFLESESINLLPTKGACLVCGEDLKWSELVAHKKKREKAREQARETTAETQTKETTKTNKEIEDKRKHSKPLLQLQQHIYVRPQTEVTSNKRKEPTATLTEVPTKRVRPVIQSLY
eukprot:TRINITY_DN2165_c0_g1_i2.p1 TRINITY_DN2165_c0_g1~~TRINITY_DN2165_c0_g1_i2.p1  ORF type:complete len:204 (+),score=40.32 TRINITY_DN2165_c0_g1_i2:567-1178(+)